MKLKIATFNIRHCENYDTEKIDFDAFAEKILSLDADVIGLNEVRGKGDAADYRAQAEILARKTGYSYYFAKATDIGGRNNPYGNAVLTRKKIASCGTVPIPDPEVRGFDGYYETRCVLKLRLEEPALTVLITHFGLNPDEQENAVKTVLDNLTETKCVLMGDLNVQPDDKLLDPIRARMSDTVTAIEGSIFTFPSFAPDRKIDYIFTSRDIKTRKSFVPDGVLSDHLPYVAEIDIAE